MKLDLLAPYYQHIENPSEEIKIKISAENPKSYALTRAPNRMNSDGRINLRAIYECGECESVWRIPLLARSDSNDESTNPSGRQNY